jgi:hypothetical protein
VEVEKWGNEEKRKRRKEEGRKWGNTDELKQDQR